MAYTPQPTRISNPRDEVKRLIIANTVGSCVSTPSFDKDMLVVKFVCGGQVGNGVARLDKVKSIELQQYAEWYRVLVHHEAGITDFSWTSKSLDDMQRLADALTALSMPVEGGVTGGDSSI